MRRFDLRRNEGVAMAEFSLIVPVFLLLVVGLLGFGRVFYYWIQTNHVASETARWAVVDRNPYAPKSLQQQAVDSATIEFQSGAKACIDYPGNTQSSAEFGDPVRVRIQIPFSIIPFVDLGTITIRGSSTMRIERFDGTSSDPTAYSDTQNIGSCT